MKQSIILLISFLLIASIFSCSHTKSSEQEIFALPEEEALETVKTEDPKAPSVVGMSNDAWDEYFAEAKIKQKQTEEARALAAAKAEAEKAEKENIPEPVQDTKPVQDQVAYTEEKNDTATEELSEPVLEHVIEAAEEPEKPAVPPAPVFASVIVKEMHEEPKIEDNVRLSGEDIHTVTPVKDKEDDILQETSAEQPDIEPIVYIYEERVQKEPEGEDGTEYLREIQEKFEDINTEKAPEKDKSETVRLIILASVCVIAVILMCLLIKRVTYRRPEKKKVAAEEKQEEKKEEFVPATFSPGNDEIAEEVYEEMNRKINESYETESSDQDNKVLEEADISVTDDKQEEYKDESGSAEQDMLDLLEE